MNLCQPDAEIMLLRQLFTTLNDCSFRMAVVFLQLMIEYQREKPILNTPPNHPNTLKEAAHPAYHERPRGVNTNRILSLGGWARRASGIDPWRKPLKLRILTLLTELDVTSS